MNAYDMVSSVATNTVNEVGVASKTKLGVVQIGDNIDVTEAGEISVKNATTTTAGVLKKPLSNAQFLGTNSNGDFISVDVVPSGGTVAVTDYHIVDLVYPVGSVFITA